MINRLLPTLLFAPLALSLSGCAAMDGLAVGLFDEDDDLVQRGQTVLFVATDPSNLQTDLYVAQAVGSGGEFEEGGPDVGEAVGFEVTRITDLGIGLESSPLSSESDSLFSDQHPFPVPDRDGARVAIMASLRDESTGYTTGGRVAVLDLTTFQTEVGEDIEGLVGVRWTWAGGAMLLERQITGDEARSEVLVQMANASPVRAGPESSTSTYELAGLERSTDRFLLHERDLEAGTTDVWLVDAISGDSELLTGGVEDRVDQPILDASGRWLAVTAARPETALRSVAVIDLSAGPDAPATELTDGEANDCFWPTWSPGLAEDDPSRLAFVCRSAATERPDLLMWDPASPDDGAITLTGGPQPFIFAGTMDGLVVRSEPQWDPLGTFLVFGASTQDDALDGSGMTLLVLPVESDEGDPIAFPIWSGDEGSAGSAHFSAASDTGALLLWDRTETGLEDSSGRHPIHIVFTDEALQTSRPVEIGQDLLVSYPLFLGSNTMLYPSPRALAPYRTRRS